MTQPDEGGVTVHELTLQQAAEMLAPDSGADDWSPFGLGEDVGVVVRPSSATEEGTVDITLELTWHDGTETREDYRIYVRRLGAPAPEEDA